MHANFGVGAPNFAAIKAGYNALQMRNQILRNHNIKFLPNFSKQTQNNAIFGNEFRNKTVLAVSEAIFGVCLSYFGARQVCISIK